MDKLPPYLVLEQMIMLFDSHKAPVMEVKYELDGRKFELTMMEIRDE